MNRLKYVDLFHPWPEGDIWMDTPMRDIPNTMVAAIKNASPQVRAVSISCVEITDKTAKLVEVAAKEKGIDYLPTKDSMAYYYVEHYQCDKFLNAASIISGKTLKELTDNKYLTREEKRELDKW